MKNFVKIADTVTLNAPYAVTSGQGLLVGNLFGAASADAAINMPVETQLVGSLDFPKETGTGMSFAQGALVYWDNTNRRMTTTSAGNKRVGAATVAATTSDTIVRVRLDGVATA